MIRACATLAFALALSAHPTAAAQRPADPDRDRAGQVGAILHVAAGEYELAIVGGALVDSAEYLETRTMIGQARELAAPLLGQGTRGARLQAALDSTAARVDRNEDVARVREAVDRVREILYEGWGAVALPRPAAAPSSARGAALYRTHCATCHGSAGRGDGPGSNVTPPPTDFTDPAVALEASPSRLFQVMSYGIPGTAMRGWRDLLSEQDRWDLVAHLDRLGFSDGQRRAGAEIFGRACSGCHTSAAGATSSSGRGATAPGPTLTEVEDQADRSGLDLIHLAREGHDGATGLPLSDSEGAALVAYTRTLLEKAGTGGPAERASEVAAAVRSRLDAALASRRGGEYEAARRAAIDAYLQFEGMERPLRVRAPDLTRSLEDGFTRFREAVSEPGHDVTAVNASLRQDLGLAVDRLSGGSTAWSDFVSSLVIILREGLEAILIIGALLAFLARSGNPEHQGSIYWGAGIAIAASLLTAAAIQLIFEIAPVHQEILEGATMLVAVAVLFSVSYWLVSKLEHKRWEGYIRSKMSMALSRGSRLALGSVAFLAVYREGFETVLFYKALMGAATSSALVVAGLGLGSAVLVGVCVGIYRFGVRIPLRPFFGLTSGILYYMAFVFAGKGINELQEAGAVGVTRVAGLGRLPLIGFYPTVETLTVQVVLVAALLAALLWTFVVKPARTRVPEAAEG